MPTIDKMPHLSLDLMGKEAFLPRPECVAVEKNCSYLVLLRPWSGLEGQLVELVSFSQRCLKRFSQHDYNQVTCRQSRFSENSLPK